MMPPLRRGLPNRVPMLRLTFRSLRLRGWSQGDSSVGMMGVQVKEIVCLGTNEVILCSDEGLPSRLLCQLIVGENTAPSFIPLTSMERT